MTRCWLSETHLAITPVGKALPCCRFKQNKWNVAFDDNYTLPGMVTILSMLQNSEKDTFYEIKVLCGKELSTNNKVEINK